LIFRPYYSTYNYDHYYNEGYQDGYRDGYNDGLVSESVKAQIRRQIESEIQDNQNDGVAPSGIMDKLSDPNYILVVSESITTVPFESSGRTCTLSEGDLLQAIRAPQYGDPYARMKVLTSKKESCTAGTEVLISMEDLQKFQNEFSETLEDGVRRLEDEKDQLSH